jgi:hypothetical protein
LSDLQFLCYAKPTDAAQEHVSKNSLRTRSSLPLAWEAALPAGKGKRENFMRFLPHRTVIAGTSTARNLGTPFARSMRWKNWGTAQAGADIELRNSMLALDFDNRLINSSMASTVESGLKTLRSTHTRLNSSGGRSSSSLRVPER